MRRNIAASGRDPARVTIFGESAGGVNVRTLIVSPLGEGLFERALVQSGGCTQRPLSEFVAFGNTLTDKAGCASDVDPAACLRAVPFDALLRALPPVVTVASASGQLWGPAVDGFVLRDSPEVVIGKGEHVRVPFVIGANADETGSAAPLISSEAEYRTILAAQLGSLAPLVLARYPASACATPRKAYVAVTTDARFGCPSRRFARAAAKGGSPVFRSVFSSPANRVFGAVHGIEIPFVFGTFDAIQGYTPGATKRALGIDERRLGALRGNRRPERSRRADLAHLRPGLRPDVRLGCAVRIGRRNPQRGVRLLGHSHRRPLTTAVP